MIVKSKDKLNKEVTIVIDDMQENYLLRVAITDFLKDNDKILTVEAKIKMSGIVIQLLEIDKEVFNG